MSVFPVSRLRAVSTEQMLTPACLLIWKEVLKEVDANVVRWRRDG